MIYELHQNARVTLYDEYVNQVLNAGKNKLKSMDQIASLTTIRALILNGEAS